MHSSTTTSITNNFIHAAIGQLVAAQPARSRVLEKWGLDYCCGGKRTLGEACAAKGIDAHAVADELMAADTTATRDPDSPWVKAPLGELTQHIVYTHHEYLRHELPRLTYLMERVRNAHGKKHPELHELYQILLGFCIEIDSHAQKEERVLFPLIEQLEASQQLLPDGNSIADTIVMMEEEHDHAGDALARMRAATDNFTPPDDTCSTHRVLLHALADLEADMHQHVHKENNILFPRALVLEAELRGRS